MPKRKKDDEGLRLAVEAMGNRKRRLALALGISPQSLHRWHRVPAARIIDVERVTGVDRAKLRPDLYKR